MSGDTTGPVAGPRPLRFAVVGCGVIGVQHAKVITSLAGAELTVAVDEVDGAAERLTAAYGGAPMVSLEQALARDDVDAVAICTPSGNHAEPAIAALRAGKHVLVEKPVDISLEAAGRLAEAEAQSPGVVTVISQHRYDPSSLAVHDAVQRGLLGVVTSGVASVSWWRSQSYYESGLWRGTWALDGGGALMNQGIHTVDLLVWMLGRPVEVTAYTAHLAHTDIEVEDTAVAIVRFESGALGVVHATTAAYPGLTARLQIHGDRGSAIINDDRLEYLHADTIGPDSEALAHGANGTAGADPATLSDAHSLQYADFIDAIRSARPPQVTIQDAATTLAVVLAIYRSASEGRPVPVLIPDLANP